MSAGNDDFGSMMARISEIRNRQDAEIDANVVEEPRRSRIRPGEIQVGFRLGVSPPEVDPDEEPYNLEGISRLGAALWGSGWMALYGEAYTEEIERQEMERIQREATEAMERFQESFCQIGEALAGALVAGMESLERFLVAWDEAEEAATEAPARPGYRWRVETPITHPPRNLGHPTAPWRPDGKRQRRRHAARKR